MEGAASMEFNLMDQDPFDPVIVKD